MSPRLTTLLAVFALLAATPLPTHGQRDRAEERPSNSREAVTAGTASLIEVAEVPSEENGVVTVLNIKEGDVVTAGKQRGLMTPKQVDEMDESKESPPLVALNTDLPRRQKAVARKEYNKAYNDAVNDINKRYAEAAAEVAKAAYLKTVDANRKVPDSIAAIEVDRLRLDWKRADLQIEQAAHEQKLAILTMDVKAEEFAASDDAIQRRKIYSPISGMVTNVYIHKGEWVKSGDPVFRVVNLDKLRVIGRLNIKEHDPADVAGKPVSVTVLLRGGRTESLQGRVVFVDPELQAGEKYGVWAEVTNRKAENGHYVLLPGSKCDLRIDTAGTATASREVGR